MKLLNPGDKLYRISVTDIHDDEEPCLSVSLETYEVIVDHGGFGGVCIQQSMGAPSHLLVIDHLSIGQDSHRRTNGGYSPTVEGAIELYRQRCEYDVAELKKKIAEKERLFGALFQVANKLIEGDHFHDVRMD